MNYGLDEGKHVPFWGITCEASTLTEWVAGEILGVYESHLLADEGTSSKQAQTISNVCPSKWGCNFKNTRRIDSFT